MVTVHKKNRGKITFPSVFLHLFIKRDCLRREHSRMGMVLFATMRRKRLSQV